MLKITGYSDRTSARPGETIKCMVNCERPSYRADLVRLICGDENPAGPGYKEIVVRAPINRRYRGRRQTIEAGSYGMVESARVLEDLASFTVAAYVWPTTPAKGEQALISKREPGSSSGFALMIDGKGALSFRIGAGRGRSVTVSSGRRLRDRCWYVVAAIVDAERRTVTLVQEPIAGCVGVNDRRTVTQRLSARPESANGAPLLIAAELVGRKTARLKTTAHYNGKIDSPRFARGALAPSAIETLLRTPLAERFGRDLVAAWDFSIEIPTTRPISAPPPPWTWASCTRASTA